ncbi:Hint domain-containing protein [Rhodobacter lacus]|uniref:Hint domain-containing protein n=1 Tax=Rhodobacter lacus TaxID=1641972 RepID=A0ABW5A6V8_9RHOB
MSYSHRVGAGQVVPVPAAEPLSPAALPHQVIPAPRPVRAMPLTRRYEAMWCDGMGAIQDSTRLAPATPLFEEAFSALARGSVIATEQGPVAVEDLLPGMRAKTGEGGLERVTWVGSMVIYPDPHEGEGREPVRLTRITAEALGAGRPMPDLVLGPRARLCLRDPRLMGVIGREVAYVPARAFIDGVSVIEVTPLAPVTVYHVVLENHGSLRVAGLEVEAFHPGEGVERMIDPRMLSLFEAQFPQLEGLSGFGPLAHPRLTRFEVESLWV